MNLSRRGTRIPGTRGKYQESLGTREGYTSGILLPPVTAGEERGEEERRKTDEARGRGSDQQRTQPVDYMSGPGASFRDAEAALYRLYMAI